MDRDDARLVAAALGSRISGDREELDRLAREAAVRLMASAAVLRGAAADWQPAHLAAFELEAIARLGSGAASTEPNPELQKVVDSLTKLVNEPEISAGPRNRFERRARVSGKTLARQRRLELRALRSPVPA